MRVLVAFVGCSGVGKNTIIKDLIQAHGDEYDILPTLTTRDMRKDERQGDPYYFVSEEEFLRQLSEGLVYEHQTVHNHYYGGSRAVLNMKKNTGKTLLKDIDILGANTLKNTISNEIRVLSVFLYVDDADTLLYRLRGRGETEEEIEVRRKRFEMEMGLSSTSDYMINNVDREATGRMIDQLIRAENAGAEYRRARGCERPDEAIVARMCAEARAGASLARVELGFNGREFLVLDGADRYAAARRAGAFIQKRISSLPDEGLSAAEA